jgi:hypothetical protein
MTREEVLAALREIQARARAIRAGVDNPTVERVAQQIEQHCHVARWDLGDVGALTAEVEGGD